jgi:hypothetical protein
VQLQRSLAMEVAKVDSVTETTSAAPSATQYSARSTFGVPKQPVKMLRRVWDVILLLKDFAVDPRLQFARDPRAKLLAGHAVAYLVSPFVRSGTRPRAGAQAG